MAHPERIVIAARSGLLRAANIRLLVDSGFEVVGEASDGPGLVRKVRAHRPSVAIVDASRADIGAGQFAPAIRAIRSELPGVGVLTLSDAVDDELAAALLHAGADGVGYLLERRVADVARYARAIVDVSGGGSVLEPEVVTRMLERDRPDPALGALNDRDQQVLAQIAAGVTNRAIAQRMFISERAVERHVTHIFGALGIGRSRLVHRRVLAALAYLRAV
jgi:DNA-binding NarL/FixJ family response regulator